MSTCCRNCTRLVYMEPFKTAKESSKWFYNSSAYSIMLPVLSTSTSTKYFGNPFVKLIKSPGVAYVTIDKSAERFVDKTLQSLGGTWPLIVTVALWTVEGGIIMWLLVCYNTSSVYCGFCYVIKHLPYLSWHSCSHFRSKILFMTIR